MKKILYAILFLTVISSVTSCTKSVNGISKQVVIDTTIAPGADYLLDLSAYANANAVATISKQATTFTTSEITRTSARAATVYHYSVLSKTAVSDQVVLAVTENSRENCRRKDTTTITINLLVR